jgi:hypothetical protein
MPRWPSWRRWGGRFEGVQPSDGWLLPNAPPGWALGGPTGLKGGFRSLPRQYPDLVAAVLEPERAATAGAAGGRSRLLPNFAPDRLGWRGWAAGQGGNGAEFPFFKLAAGCTSLTTFSGSSPSSTTGLRAISAHILFPPLATCYARHGVDRPAGRYAGLHSRFHVPSVQHGSATMLKPMIDIPLASLRCPPEALPGRPETDDTVAAA